MSKNQNTQKFLQEIIKLAQKTPASQRSVWQKQILDLELDKQMQVGKKMQDDIRLLASESNRLKVDVHNRQLAVEKLDVEKDPQIHELSQRVTHLDQQINRRSIMMEKNLYQHQHLFHSRHHNTMTRRLQEQDSSLSTPKKAWRMFSDFLTGYAFWFKHWDVLQKKTVELLVTSEQQEKELEKIKEELKDKKTSWLNKNTPVIADAQQNLDHARSEYVRAVSRQSQKEQAFSNWSGGLQKKIKSVFDTHGKNISSDFRSQKSSSSSRSAAGSPMDATTALLWMSVLGNDTHASVAQSSVDSGYEKGSGSFGYSSGSDATGGSFQSGGSFGGGDYSSSSSCDSYSSSSDSSSSCSFD